MDDLKGRLLSFSDKKIGILGTSGQVGRRIVSMLAEYGFPKDQVTLVAQNPTQLSYGHANVVCKLLDRIALNEFDIVLNCMPSEVTRNYISEMWHENCFIVDLSSAFRMEADVPLIVPEVNGDQVKASNLVASPNCIAAPLSLVLHPILKELHDVHQVAVSTYQSVSGAGNAAINALLDETKKSFFDPKVKPEFFEKQIAFNLLPKIGEFDENYATSEEIKIEQETNKILSRTLPISVVAVRVPVLLSHCIALHLACQFKNMQSIENVLCEAPGVGYVPDGKYMSPIEAAHEELVYVSRLKRTSSGIAMWITCDNLAKGAALNALQIVASKFS